MNNLHQASDFNSLPLLRRTGGLSADMRSRLVQFWSYYGVIADQRD